MIQADGTFGSGIGLDLVCDLLWTEPCVITTVRTGKTSRFFSLLKTSYRTTPTAYIKHHQTEPVYLTRLGFEGDQQTYSGHGGPQKTVLQYDASHYTAWRQELADVPAVDPAKRAARLDVGGFGENIAVTGPSKPGSPGMSERTVCIGDIIGIRDAGLDYTSTDAAMTQIQVTGPREPCYMINHKFGMRDMSQRSQNAFRTGWLYSTIQEGTVQIGQEMVLLERPFPQWTVARVQHFLYKDAKNLDMIRSLLQTLESILVFDVKELFITRLQRGVEDMTPRLLGDEGTGASPEQWTAYQLCQKRRETERISSFVFKRVTPVSECSPDFREATSGSHIRLRISDPSNSSVKLIRPYSIIGGDSNNFRLGVALADDSRGGSSYLHKSLKVGEIVEGSTIFANTFPLIPGRHVDSHVFFAGGIGITAFLDHMRSCVDKKLPFTLHYMVRNKADVAFESEIRDIVSQTRLGEGMQTNGHSEQTGMPSNDHCARVHIYHSADGERCDIRDILSAIAPKTQTHIYICGSERLSKTVTQLARGLQIPNDRLHFEQFQVDATGGPFEAELLNSQKTLSVRGQQSLLDALRDAGLEVSSSCESGNCGTCRVRVQCGKVIHRGTGLPDDEKAGQADEGDAGEMLSCVSRGVGTIQLEL